MILLDYGSGVLQEVRCLSVCLSVRERILGTIRLNFKFSMHVICGHGTVLLWRRYNMLRTSVFANDVTFIYDCPGVCSK